MARVSNWPQTLTAPIQQFMTLGLLAVGCLMVLQGDAATAPASSKASPPAIPAC
jgi:ABC-type bacteriocin/lantibiotic exporter with double-glycine peptidase domain